MELIFVVFFIAGVAAVVYFWFHLKDSLENYRSKSAIENELGLPTIANNQIIVRNAYNNYNKLLSELKHQPTNANLKERTLSLGRKYSLLTRQFHGTDGITIYDEVALMNDINAACAGAVNNAPIETVNNQFPELRLAKLSELKDKNLISQEEYETRRQKILDEI